MRAALRESKKLPEHHKNNDISSVMKFCMAHPKYVMMFSNDNDKGVYFVIQTEEMLQMYRKYGESHGGKLL